MNTKICALTLGLAGLAFGGGASANVVTLTPVDGNIYQQTVQSPCIFSNPSCTNGGFASTALPTGGSVNGYDAFSPIYSGQTLLNIIGAGNALLIGLDINQASGQPAQTLTAFYMLLNNSIVDTFSTTATNNVPAGNNGNGYADYLLGNFSSFSATDTVQFHFVFNNANDGTENLFVIGAPGSTVPEPATLALLGLGLLGAYFVRRRS
ncbi:PEP-CTERM sorting domain-containing protein [Acidovorax sp. JHL-9]|uniref:PEP-CTERM sorting domain-containing protein n=1 Tax=Acidovorax sp. JHL-9 TaxID=1276756 RepID=UPI0004110022|nr:PEP-CTERM sorting domain-containing protein [Acidovorax sp. JHL-9]